MAEDTQGNSPKNEAARSTADGKEDAETRAARRELKQSSISDPPPETAPGAGEDRPATPEDAAAERNEELKELVSSPKKKRAHDQLDHSKDDEQNDAESVASADSAKDRASRLEPEKKRHRDEEGGTTADEDTNNDKKGSETETETKNDTEAKKSETTGALQTSSSAFAASGFGKLAAGTSPFAGLGGAKSTGFGLGGKPALSSFASGAEKAPSTSLTGSNTATAAAAPKLSFGGAGNAPPFGGLPSGTNGFGSGSGGFGSGTGSSGFASLTGGAKPLSTFGASGSAPKPFQSQKPAKPFGAPESDVEESDEGEEEEDPESAQAETERAGSPEKDQEKKVKLHKVDVDDGEASEATVLSVRAKMFVHEKEAGWKERGAGMLKINVPKSCVEYDDNNAVVPGSFDASGLDDGDEESSSPKVVRLVMRQDQTHRVILNTAVVPAMKFQEKTTLKSVAIIFTAFEGAEGKPVTVTMRMSTANGKNFLNEVESVQRELQNR